MPRIREKRSFYYTTNNGDNKITVTCPHCGEEYHQVLVGPNASGSRRLMCKICKRKYTPRPKPRGRTQYSDDMRRSAEFKYFDLELSLREIARILGISHQTAANWINKSDRKRRKATKPH